MVWCDLVRLATFIPGGNNKCFYKPGTAGNPFFHNIGLLNVNEKIVIGATIGGKPGAHRGDNPFYAFDFGRQIGGDEEVKHSRSYKMQFSIKIYLDHFGCYVGLSVFIICGI